MDNKTFKCDFSKKLKDKYMDLVISNENKKLKPRRIAYKFYKSLLYLAAILICIKSFVWLDILREGQTLTGFFIDFTFTYVLAMLCLFVPLLLLVWLERSNIKKLNNEFINRTGEELFVEEKQLRFQWEDFNNGDMLNIYTIPFGDISFFFYEPKTNILTLQGGGIIACKDTSDYLKEIKDDRHSESDIYDFKILLSYDNKDKILEMIKDKTIEATK